MQIYKRANSVMQVEVDGSVILFESEQLEYMKLTGTACRIWKILEKASSMEQIVQTLCEEHDVEPQECLDSVSRFMTELNSAKLINIEEVENEAISYAHAK